MKRYYIAIAVAVATVAAFAVPALEALARCPSWSIC